jgi:hypothetical protein
LSEKTNGGRPSSWWDQDAVVKKNFRERLGSQTPEIHWGKNAWDEEEQPNAHGMACSSNHGDRSRGGSHTLSFALHE